MYDTVRYRRLATGQMTGERHFSGLRSRPRAFDFGALEGRGCPFLSSFLQSLENL